MNTNEIERTVARDKCLNKYFLGVFPCDKLPMVLDRPACFIANTDPSSSPGEHWVAMFFDKYVEYFDSYGLEPCGYFTLYKPEKLNSYCLQDFDTAVCGEYCIYYLAKRVRCHQLADIVDYLRKRSDKNDSIVKLYVDKARVEGPSTHQSCTCRGFQR